MVVEARTWLEHLPHEDCWQLLAVAHVGRVGVLVDSAPEIYPINFVVDDHTIVFRTDAGSKLHGLDRSPSCCLEADVLDVESHTGWSVLVKGRATEIVSPEDLQRVSALPLEFWTHGQKAHWIRILPAEVTGRRVHRIESRTT